nr:unnamed protein product [Callosobruchus analis]
MHRKAPASTTAGLCPLCDVGVKNGDHIITHLEEAHGVIVESETLNFNTFEEFVQWRDKMYVDTMSQFARARGVDKVKNGERMYLNCHHSGRYRGRGSGYRYRDPNKICKRGRVCPARLVVTCTLEGVEVVFYKTHVGHSNESKYLRLTHSEREEIAGMLLDNVPHQEIIQTIGSKMPSSRERTIKLQDLYNIRRDFHIDVLKEIMRSHARSLEIRDEMVETVLENVWNVKLNNEDTYTVVLDSKIICSGCRLSCWVCRVCVHQFSCTCSDHLLNGNFCKHIHACAHLQKFDNPTETSDEANISKDDQNYYINTHEKESETEEASFVPQNVERRQNLSLLLNASLGIISTFDNDSFKKAVPIIKRYIDDIMRLKQERLVVRSESTNCIYTLKETNFKEDWL